MNQGKSPLVDGMSSSPKGGGAISGLGEAFQPNLNIGSGSYSVPIELPPGFRQQTPKLALAYSTTAPAGAFGFGWSAPTLGIQRSTTRGVPSFSDEDRFLLAGTVLEPMGAGRYRPRVDESFRRIMRLADGWEVTTPDGTRRLLGVSADARVFAPDVGSAEPLVWLLEEEIDTTGNRIQYGYLRDGGHLYLQRIEYAVYRVALIYEPRPDVLVDRSGGFAVSKSLRCSRIEIHRTDVSPTLLRQYDLSYRQSPLAGHSLLERITLTGYAYRQTGSSESGPIRESLSAPPLRFEYTDFDPQQRGLSTMDITGDPPPAPGSRQAEVVDLDGFGLPGILQATGATQRYWSNRQGAWRSSKRIADAPFGLRLGDPEVRLADMDGDGRTDLLVSHGALAGYYPQAGVATGGSPGWDRPRLYRQRPNFLARDPAVRYFDANGDGVADAVRTARRHLTLFRNDRSRGWQDPPRVQPRRRNANDFPDLHFGDPRVRLAHMSGDGVLSWVRLFARHLEYWPELGELQWDGRVLMPLPGPHPVRFNPERAFLIDADGDGRADLLYLDGRRVFLWINRGAAFAPPVVFENAPPADPDSVRVGDFLGRGSQGLLFQVPGALRRGRSLHFLSFATRQKPYLLSRIDNSVGGVTEIEYGYSTEHCVRDRDQGRPWATSLPFPVPVVNAITKSDPTTGASERTEMRYHDGHYDGLNKRFLGFADTETVEEGGPEAEGRITRNRFYNGLPGEVAAVPAERAEALAGKMWLVEVVGASDSDKPYQRETIDWIVKTPEVATDGTPILVPCTQRRTIEQLDQQSTGRTQQIDYVRDRFGNVTEETRTASGGAVGGSARVIRTTTTIAANFARWLVNLPAQRIVADGAGNVFSCERYLYDGVGDDPLPLGEAEQGLLRVHLRQSYTDDMVARLYPDLAPPAMEALGYVRVAGATAPQGWWSPQRRVDYNPNGTMRRVHDPTGNVTEIGYDVTGLFPVLQTNSHGHTRSADYDPWQGVVVRLTHWTGQTDRYRYTPLGHVAAEIRPGDSDELPTVQYQYRFDSLPISTVMERRRRSGEAAVYRSVTYYDGLGEQLQVRKSDGARFVVDGLSRRNARGDVVLQVTPFFAPGEAFDVSERPTDEEPFRLEYDAMSRLRRMTRAGGHEQRTVYHPQHVDFYDPEDLDPVSPHFDTPVRQEADAWGFVSALVESHDGSPVRNVYERDELGRLVTHRDPGGAIRLTQLFDMLGRKVRVTHADAGSRTFLFTAAGHTVRMEDGAGRLVEWDFDLTGRVLETRHEGVPVERYTYDTGAGANLQNRLARVEDEAGWRELSYDGRGRVVRATRGFDGVAGTYSFEMDYDPDDRLLRLTYPDGHEVGYKYDDRALVHEIGGLFHLVDYDARGRRTRVRYTHGVTEHFTYFPDLGTPETHRIERTADNALLYGRRYRYNRNNQMVEAVDLRPAANGYVPINRTFAYDTLDRVTEATTMIGAEARALTYDYDAGDNLTHLGEAPVADLAYVGTRLVGPAGDPSPPAYQYDPSGNVIQRPGQVLEFDVRQMLRTVTRDDGGVVTFDYDHRGRRVRKRLSLSETNEETLYVGERFEIRPGGVTARAVRTPASESRLIRVGTAPAMLLVADIFGNIVLRVEHGGGQSARREYHPFGRDALKSGTTEEIGFGGRGFDPETGLYYFRRRYYDPDTGRFISADAYALLRIEKLVSTPRALHIYAYGSNNPLTYTDPTGLLSLGWLEIVGMVLLVAATVALTILTAGALAPLVGISVGAMATIIGTTMVGAMIVGGIIGAIQGGGEGLLVGMLLGLSIAATVFLGAWFYGAVLGFGAIAGFAIGGTFGAIQALAFVPQVRQNDVYKGILGWTSWLNPWAWPGIALGIIVFIVDFIGTLIVGNQNDDHMLSLDFDPRYGMVIVKDSALSNVDARGFNFGTFSWLSPSADAGTQSHEAGHALNNALFGVFQVTTFLAYNIDHDDRLFEIMAEGNTDPDSGDPVRYTFDDLDWWS